MGVVAYRRQGPGWDSPGSRRLDAPLCILLRLGACDLSFAEASDSERIIQMFVAFHAMVVRDGIDPQVAHTAFLEIDEYRAVVDGGAEFYENI